MTSRRRPKLKHWLEYIVLRALVFLLRLLPHEAAVALGGAIGRALWALGVRRKVAKRNFKLCFGDRYSDREANEILKRSYDFFCRSVVEYALLPKLGDRVLSLVSLEGKELLDELAGQGRGAILVTGHFGSWELFGAALAKAGYKIDFLVGTQKNPLVDELMNAVRRSVGIGIIHIGVAARGVLRSLRAGRMVAMLSDQDAGADGVVVKFFGNPASTPRGAAAFAAKTRCPIVAGYIVRNADGFTHRGIVERLLPPKLSGNAEDDIKSLTQFFTDVLERGVRAHPDHYFWAHRRFKSTIGY